MFQKVSAKEYAVSYTPLPAQSSKVKLQGYHLPLRLRFTPLSELHVLRDVLMHKYGREFSLGVMENHDGCVSDRVSVPLPLLPLLSFLFIYLLRLSRNLI